MSAPRSALPGGTVAGTLVAVVALLAPGVLAFGPVFGGAEGYLAAGGGALLGVGVALAARRFRWALASTAAVTVVVYLLFGGALALRRTTIAGVVPTADTLLRLVPLSVQGWRDLLTVSPPADAFVGPAVVPYLTGLLCGVLTGWFALGVRRYLWALAPALGLLTVAILWGLDDAPLAAALGAGFGAVALLWAVWRGAGVAREASDEIIAGGSAGLGRRRLGGAAAVVALATAAALALSPLLAGGPTRQVLRQTVQPPLNVTDYASPLTSYRSHESDAREVTLFTVAGLPAGARIRLATLDAYDGHVFHVADASAGFVRIGDRTVGSAPGTPTTLQVDIKGYEGVWLPGGGDVRGVRFAGPQAEQEAGALYYNSYGGTLLTTAGVAEGSSYALDLVLPPTPADVPDDARPAPASLPALGRVPEVVGTTATELAGDAATPLAQLRALEKHLREEGFYSNGTTSNSLAGHSTARVAKLLEQPMIGDDEQYAVAMALMARQLGIPARVVMGFYPDTPAAGGTLAVTGAMAHVWVEAPFEGYGWVTFDPTPKRAPIEQQPKPQPNPKPQVLPPPDPPVNQPQDPLDTLGKKADQAETPGENLLFRILAAVGLGLGAAAVVAAPFVAIGALKRRRQRLRRTADSMAARVSGGWAELVDAATDLGVRLSPVATRRETSLTLHGLYPAAMTPRVAAAVDAGVFGAAAPTEQAAAAVWAEVDGSLAAMRAQVGRWRRVRAFCSLRSFGRSRLRPAVPDHDHRAGLLRRRPRKASA